MTSWPRRASSARAEIVRFEKPGAPQTGASFQPSGKPATFSEPTPVLSAVPGPTYELASWGRRLAAVLIDGAVVIAMLALVGTVVWQVVDRLTVDLPRRVYEVGYGDTSSSLDFTYLLIGLLTVSVFGLVVSLTYAPVWMWRTNGRTLGKQLLGIRVVRADGTRMTYGFAVFREFLVKGVLGAIASAFTLYLYALADALWPLGDSERRAIHDHIARTRVIRD